MNVFEQINRNYNYYPTTAIELCHISYYDQDKISKAVSANKKLKLKVVWGPVKLTHFDDITYSLMFVASNDKTGEYFVVIRGTNVDSLSTWLKQDFSVETTKHFSALPYYPLKVPDNALISEGTFNGMSDLISLKDPGTNQRLVELLREQKFKYLYVTGHSLGGTLAPPLLAYLNAMLYGGKSIRNMALWSFAGLTPGGSGFNDYFNSIFPNNKEFFWRIQNSLDIAPFLFCSKANVENIYDSHPHLKQDIFVKVVFDCLFDKAKAAQIGYAQPQKGQVIHGQFDKKIHDEGLFAWTHQVIHQHGTKTYKKLVNKMYPYTPPH